MTDNKNIPHVNVIICTPGHSVMGSYLKSLLPTIDWLAKNNITWAYSNEYSSMVSDAREMTLSGTPHNSLVENRPFMGNITYDKLIWIDSDISWKVEDFKKIYESDKDIVSGAYMIGSGDVMAYKKILNKAFTFEEIKNEIDLIKIEACGLGFAAVKQGVFESLSRPWFQAAMTSVFFEDGKQVEFPIMGEDISFCKRALDNGFEIWLDPTVKVTHHKTMQLTWEGIMP